MGNRLGLGAMCALAVAAGTAHGGLLPVHVGITPEGANFRYEYSILLQSDAVLKPGDYFTIFDFAGYVADSGANPGNFTFSTSSTGPVPAGVVPSDDASVPNLTWTYVGADGFGGPSNLGTFSAVSHYEGTTDDHFTGQTHRQVDGHLNSNITDTEVPVPSHHCGAPEPSSALLLLIAVPVVLAARALWRRA